MRRHDIEFDEVVVLDDPNGTSVDVEASATFVSEGNACWIEDLTIDTVTNFDTKKEIDFDSLNEEDKNLLTKKATEYLENQANEYYSEQDDIKGDTDYQHSVMKSLMRD